MPVFLFMWPTRCRGSLILLQAKFTLRRPGIGFPNLRPVCLYHTSAGLEIKRDRTRRWRLGIPKIEEQSDCFFRRALSIAVPP